MPNINHSLSIFSVLQTALPSSLLSQALAGKTQAVISEVSAEFKTETPGWFSSLPADIKTLLDPTITHALPIPTHSSGLFPSGSANATVFHNSTSASGAPSNSMNGTRSSTSSLMMTSSAMSSMGMSSVVPSGSQASGSASTSPSTGAASVPTAIYGMGVAGAVGLVGLLAL